MTIRAVLFDVGGPIATEIEHERAIDEDIRSLFAEAGMPVSDARYAEAWRSVVDSFAPNAYEAVIRQLAEGDEEGFARSVYSEVARRSHARGLFELRQGIAELLAELTDRGLKLGLAANQPAEVIARMGKAGIATYFQSTAVSGVHGYYKPDVRLFLHACEALGVAPKNASWSAIASTATSCRRRPWGCAPSACAAAATPARSRAATTSARTPKRRTCRGCARRSSRCWTERLVQ